MTSKNGFRVGEGKDIRFRHREAPGSVAIQNLDSFASLAMTSKNGFMG